MPGQIVHFELPSANVDREAGFWGGLFGYQIGPSTMEGFDYRMFQASESQGGAVMPSDKAGQGLIVYFDTDDTAGDKQPVPTHGWFAACSDTEGNAFSLWQADENAA